MAIWSMLSVLSFTFQLIYHVYGDDTIKGLWDLKQKGIIKTIKVDRNDIIDCFDIYKQPAFNNPLIKDLLMKPSHYPFGMDSNSNSKIEMLQDWYKNEECPEGTIPIRRNTNSSNLYRTKSLPIMRQQLNRSLEITSGHEHAVVTDEGSTYYGASGIFNVWNPNTEDNEFSLSQIWVTSRADFDDFYNKLNAIEAGWTVNPHLFGDKQTRLFVYWTRDGYRKTGCYNFMCEGFIQTNRVFTIGMPLKPISIYGGKQWLTSINIFKDSIGNWWLQVQGSIVGYWPASILTGLAKEANFIEWGGEITNHGRNNHHTSTQMGSGRFPTEGFRKSCFIKNLKVLDTGYKERDPGYLTKIVTNPTCYDLTLTKNKGNAFGTHIFFGGSGFSPKCQ